ncbi:MAG: hypothetical protein M3P18_26055, partial [Actinomycetota bacterium]|nr:hypothetical protein [Actinomycetota bacterium]
MQSRNRPARSTELRFAILTRDVLIPDSGVPRRIKVRYTIEAGRVIPFLGQQPHELHWSELSFAAKRLAPILDVLGALIGAKLRAAGAVQRALVAFGDHRSYQLPSVGRAIPASASDMTDGSAGVDALSRAAPSFRRERGRYCGPPRALLLVHKRLRTAHRTR